MFHILVKNILEYYITSSYVNKAPSKVYYLIILNSEMQIKCILIIFYKQSKSFLVICITPTSPEKNSLNITLNGFKFKLLGVNYNLSGQNNWCGLFRTLHFSREAIN